jgi:hypothetical protein
MINCHRSGALVRVPPKSFSESDWLESTDPQEMLLGLPEPGPVSNRKLRSFAYACCLRMSSRLTHRLSREAMSLAERYTDGVATDLEMENLAHRFMEEYNARLARAGGDWAAMNTVDLDAAYAMALQTFPANTAFTVWAAAEDQAEERATQCQCLRCILGNPFRPVTIDPAWRTSNVTALAQAIYDDRAFDRLPILGDALEDSGCDNAEILGHCRSGGEHVRGCWVVDLMLGKE